MSATPAQPALPGLARRMEQAVACGVFCGGVLRVQRGAELVHQSCHGRTEQGPRGRPVDAATCFDLASLTKVLSATPLTLLAVQRGELALSDPLSRHLRGYGGQGREAIRVSHLLEHSSGLAAWRAYYQELAAWAGGELLATRAGRQAIRRMVAAEAPAVAPGSRAEYSDLGFILLDWLLARACGADSARLFAERLAGPLGLDELFFIDLTDERLAARARQGRVFAATERCPWRGRVLSGEVHDDNAYAMGGVSGHAGLFGTAEAVARLARAWLDAGRGRPGLFEPALVRRFWTRSQVPGSSRTLGFDTPAAEGSQAGSRMGPGTVGHLGFTGTSLWIDPGRELVAVLLTNRVHPTRANEAIRDFRPALHEALVAAFDEEQR